MIESVAISAAGFIIVLTNTTGYTCGSKKLIAMSRKKESNFGKINAGSPTALSSKEDSNE
jgi:hypothetical protein